MIKKAVVVFVLFLLCSSIFAVAQETDSEGTVVEECGIGCKVWQFLFGSKEARAGRAWFDRSEPLVGMASGWECKGSICTCYNINGCIDNNFKRHPSCSEDKAACTAPISAMKPGDYTVQEQSAPSAPDSSVQTPPSSTTSTGEWECAGNVCSCPEGGCQDSQGASYSSGYSNVPIDLVKGTTSTDKSSKPAAKPTSTSGSKAPAAKAAAKHTATTATSAEKIPESRPFTDADFKDEKADQQLKGKGIAGTYKGKEGVFKVEGKDLVFTEKGKDTKEVVLNKQLSETKFSPTTIKTGPSINPEAKSKLETALGAQYKAYTNPLGKDAEIFQTKDGVLTMRSADGKSVLRVEVDPETGIGKGHRIIPSKDGKTDRTEYFITQNGEILATQSENKIKIGETEYALPKGTSVNDLASGEVIIFPGSEKKKGAEAKLGGHLFTLTDFDDGTQKSIDTKTKEKADLGGTVYNPKDTKTCKQEQGCFVPAGGTVEKIVDGKLTSYWAEYNYKDSFGDRIGKTPTIEY